jgi:Flp pilus assembly protein TadG
VRIEAWKRTRSGAALVEASLMTVLFLTLVFGMFDLGIALFRMHVSSEAARQGARIAIVHGYLAPNSSTMNAWGPAPSYFSALTSQSLYANATSYTVQADDPADELAGTIRPYLVGIDPSTATIGIQWPDGDNGSGSRVSVSVTAPYHRLMPFLSGDGTTTISGSSTMTIVH